jgi:sugar transferase (PEP-CTERM system associated)
VLEGLVCFLVVVGTVKMNRIQYALPEPGIALSALLFSLLLIGVSSALGLYRLDRSFTLGSFFSRFAFALAIVSLTAYVTFDGLGYGALFQDVAGAIALYAAGGVVIARRLLEPIVGRSSVGRRLLILGTGEDALRLDRMKGVGQGRAPGYSIVGFYPLGVAKPPLVAASRVLSAWSLRETVERTQADELVVAVREQRGGVLPIKELLDCRLAGVRVTTLAAFFECAHGRIPVESLRASWLIYGDGFRQSWQRQSIKRLSDVIACLIISAAALPVLLLTALAIRIESGGPILFRQERVGAGGRVFTMLKFRSMAQDAERDGVARWAMEHDPRVSTVGRFIRRARIDELPQLVNVLKGEMSFVGPRPERPQFVRSFVEKVPYYAVRHAVKPGITGWAQIHCNYAASIEDSVTKLEYDLYYVKNHRLLLDLRILLETVVVVLSSRGAR